MASLTVRKLDEDLKKKLRLRAAKNGRSMEDEARKILDAALSEDQKGSSEHKIKEVDLGTEIHRRFAKFKIDKLDLPPRGPARPLPRFDR
jgi:plasmid stability protein